MGELAKDLFAEITGGIRDLVTREQVREMLECCPIDMLIAALKVDFVKIEELRESGRITDATFRQISTYYMALLVFIANGDISIGMINNGYRRLVKFAKSTARG